MSCRIDPLRRKFRKLVFYIHLFLLKIFYIIFYAVFKNNKCFIVIYCTKIALGSSKSPSRPSTVPSFRLSSLIVWYNKSESCPYLSRFKFSTSKFSESLKMLPTTYVKMYFSNIIPYYINIM